MAIASRHWNILHFANISFYFIFFTQFLRIIIDRYYFALSILMAFFLLLLLLFHQLSENCKYSHLKYSPEKPEVDKVKEINIKLCFTFRWWNDRNVFEPKRKIQIKKDRLLSDCFRVFWGVQSKMHGIWTDYMDFFIYQFVSMCVCVCVGVFGALCSLRTVNVERHLYFLPRFSVWIIFVVWLLRFSFVYISLWLF